jgi:hypothetical protein
MAAITSAAACQSAAAAAGIPAPYGGSVTASYVPGGCYWLTASGTFYYNSDASGGGNDLARPVCAGAPDS